MAAAPGLWAYVLEIPRTWGLPLAREIAPAAAGLQPDSPPVLVVPAAAATGEHVPALIDYARGGGHAFCFLPGPELRQATRLHLADGSWGSVPWLRTTAFTPAGLGGDLLPIVAPTRALTAAGWQPLDYLCDPRCSAGGSGGCGPTRCWKGQPPALTCACCCPGPRAPCSLARTRTDGKARAGTRLRRYGEACVALELGEGKEVEFAASCR